MAVVHNLVFHVKRFDLSDDPVTEKANIQLALEANEDQILDQLKSALNLQKVTSIIIKLRLEDNTLIPISDLLKDKLHESYQLEVTRIHQNLPAQNRSHLHAVYLEAVKSKIQSINKGLNKMESLIPNWRQDRELQNERIINELSTKVAFMNRRIDQLTPEEWKAQF